MDRIVKIRRYHQDVSVSLPNDLKSIFGNARFAAVKQIGKSLIYTAIEEPVEPIICQNINGTTIVNATVRGGHNG